MMLFGIYTCRLSGANHRLILGHDRQQMTHPRLSPNGAYLLFQRYTREDANGYATEQSSNDYMGTEIGLVRMVGGTSKIVIPAVPGILNCNATWLDNRSFIWVTTSDGYPSYKKYDIHTRAITDFFHVPGAGIADPHFRAGHLAFTMNVDGFQRIWLMGPDGQAKPVSLANYGPDETPTSGYSPGDYDPKLSPDVSKVAFMRFYKYDRWRIFTTLVNGQPDDPDTDLSGPGNIDALPDWSPDGQRLLYWHWNPVTLSQSGIYHMNPCGHDRRMVPLPRGRIHGHPSFSLIAEPDPWIFYQATLAPSLP